MKKGHKSLKKIETSSYVTIIGLLVIFILLDAFIQGSKNHIFIKYFLSIFTIPLFLGMIGYGMDHEKQRGLSFKAWFQTYFLRQILLYVLAIVIYTFFIYMSHIDVRGFSTYMRHYYPRYVLRHLYDAFFRLSFLLAIPFYQFVLYLFMKWKQSVKTYLLSVLVISLISLFILLIPQTFQIEFGVIYVFIFEKNLMFYNMIFFALGTYLRHFKFNQHTLSKRVLVRNATYTLFFLLLTSLFFILNRSDFYISRSNQTQAWILFIQTALIYLLNIVILIQLSISLKMQLIPKVKLLERIGELYQGVIVWYGALIILAFQLSGANAITNDFTLFYVYVFISAVLFIWLLYKLKDQNAISYWVFLKSSFDEEVL